MAFFKNTKSVREADDQIAENENRIMIDIGCGGAKKEGCIGIDMVDAQGVDHCIDIMHEKLPFEDGTVDYVFSSHFLEHLHSPDLFWLESSRVLKDKGVVEVWCPYGNTNDADLAGHLLRWNEAWWHHLAIDYRDLYSTNFFPNKHWHWHEINFVIDKQVEDNLKKHNFPLEFALKHFNNVCLEWGNFFTVEADKNLPVTHPIRTYSYVRGGERFYASDGNPVTEPPVSDKFNSCSK